MAIFQSIARRNNCYLPVTIGLVVMVSKREKYKELLSQHFADAMPWWRPHVRNPLIRYVLEVYKFGPIFYPRLSKNYNLTTRYILNVFPYLLIYCAVMDRSRSRCYDSIIFHWYYCLLVRGRDVPKKLEGTRHICICEYDRSIWY